MIPMAMEMYTRDREVGKKCIELLSYPSNVNSIQVVARYVAPGEDRNEKLII